MFRLRVIAQLPFVLKGLAGTGFIPRPDSKCLRFARTRSDALKAQAVSPLENEGRRQGFKRVGKHARFLSLRICG